MYNAINDCEPRLRALFPDDDDITDALPSSSTAPLAPAPLPLDLSSAPRGVGAHKWPWRYVCDMAAGFAAIRRLEDGQPSMSTADAFKEVFKGEYKYNTFREQYRAWRVAGMVAGEREKWINYGRTEAGEWHAFMREWRQGR